MLNFSKAEFVLSAPTIELRPQVALPEVIFVGKSNVGKSSIINALVKRNKLAFTSSKPGFTTLLNYFLIDATFYLVDAPGYGYSSKGRRDLTQFSTMMEGYFHNNPHLKHVYMLVDSRHEPTKEDVDFYQFVKDSQIPYTLIMTKVDKLTQKDKAAITKNLIAKFGEVPVDVLNVSSHTGYNILKLQQSIASAVK